MTIKYCYLCGGDTISRSAHGETHQQCQSCGQSFFDNPKPATEIILVTENNKIIVAVRAREPHKGKYDLPGGFLDSGETIEQGLEREVLEELGLKASDYTKPIYLSSVVDQYPWGPETHTVISLPFTARIKSSVHLEPQDDVETILYLSTDEIKTDDFAWESQYTLVNAAIEYWSQPH